MTGDLLREWISDQIGDHGPSIDRLALLMGQVWLSVKAPGGGGIESANEFEAVAPEDYTACRAIATAVFAAVDPVGVSNEAEAFARRAHAGQIDKGGAPYTGHLGRVAARARAHAEALGLDEAMAVLCAQVGWLHDTIEDTSTTAEDLRAASLDAHVVAAVERLTRPEGKPYLECVAGIIASGDRIAMIVKLSDNEDNLDPSRALPDAPPALAERYRQSAQMLRAALANSTERRLDRATPAEG